MSCRTLLLSLGIAAGAGLATAADTTMAGEQERVVHRYVAAFNAQDTKAMLSMVTDDVQWLSVDGEKIVIEASSKEELGNSLTGYFESCSSCKSRLAHIFSTGSRVSALEVASTETREGVREQQSLSVYEFLGPLIKRVYYFPAEK